MFFVWIGLASSCFFALLAVYGASYSQAVLWISVGGCAVSLGFALWEQLKTHGYPKRKRLYYSVSLAIVILILGWGLIVWVPSTPTLDLAVSSQIDIDVQPRNSKPSEPVPTLPDKQSKIPPPAIKKEIPIKPKENLAELLIKKYPVEDPAIGRYPGSFIYYWIQKINSVRIERPKPNLLAVMQKMGGPPREGPPMKELIAEATFTLRCLASEGYVQIKETSAQGRWYAVDFENLQFEFVPERLNQFLDGL